MPAPLRLTAALPLVQGSAAGAVEPLFSWNVSVANLVAAAAVVASLLAIWATRRRDVHLREVEYADRVKTAAASTLARLERAREISLHFFDVFSRSFVAASEAMKGGTKNPDQVKNFIWKKAEGAAAARSERLLDEEIELAYVDLYGYDRTIHGLFAEARALQEQSWKRVVADVKMWTQDDVLTAEPGEDGLREALRVSVKVLREELRRDFDDIVHPLRERLEEWIGASERQIVRRTVKLTHGGRMGTREPELARLSGLALEAFARGAEAHQKGSYREVDRPFSELRARIHQMAEGRPRLLTAADRLYARPGSRARQEHFGELLAAIRADEQPELAAAAARLLDVLGHPRRP